MKLIIAFFFAAFIASTTLAQDTTQSQTLLNAPPQGWYQQNNPATGYASTIFFLNRDTGWIAADLGILYTIDGGNNWEVRNPLHIHDQSFMDANNGWAVADTSLVRTSDGGANWQPTHAPVLGAMQIFGMDTIRIFNADIGSTASSNDGGKTWVNPTVGFKGGTMYFASGQIGFGGGLLTPWFGNPPPQKGTEGADFEYTIDGGLSWHAKYCSLQENLHLIFAIDEKHIYADGYNIDYTSDGGNTWNQALPAGAFYGIFFLNAQTGYAVGTSGEIVFTNDTGNTWALQNSSVTSTLTNVFFIDSLTGWASGYDHSTILHTVNGGIAWVRQYLPFDSIVVQNYPEPATSSNVSIHYTIP